MARLAARHDAKHLPPDNLLDYVRTRYLSHGPVRDWLLNREPHPVRHVHTLTSTLSYACMYYPPTFIPKTYGRYPLPKPFLDMGEFLLCQNIHDNIAIGSIFNPQEEHALSIVRDDMLRNSNFSRNPRARNFAVDLSVPYLEIVEFAWMEDHSLILACRRFHASPDAPQKPLVLSADLAFYPILDERVSPLDVLPLLRMNVRELVAVCQFCGQRGVHACACPPAFKTRAPPGSTDCTPIPFDPAAFRTQSTTSSIVKQRQSATAAENHLHYQHSSLLDTAGSDFSDVIDPTKQLDLQQVGESPLMSWDNYARRIFDCNQVGAFFVQWHRRNRAGDAMEPFIRPRHPIPYQFVCGSKRDTLRLASVYIVKLRLCQKGLAMADMRLRDDSPYSPASSFGDDDDTYDTNEDMQAKRKGHFLDYQVEYGSHHGTTRYGGSFGDESVVTDPLQASLADSFSQAATTVTGKASAVGTATIMGPAIATAIATETVTASVPSLSPGGAHGSPRAVADISLGTRGGADMGGEHADVVAGVDGDGQASESSDMASQGNKGKGTPPRSGSAMRTFEDSRDVESYMTLNENRTPTCRKCRRSFPKRGNLTRHIKIVHLGHKPFQCQVCARRFGYKTHLKRHESGHVRRHECVCYVCSQAFRGWPALQRHVRSAHAHLELFGGDDAGLLDDPGL